MTGTAGPVGTLEIDLSQLSSAAESRHRRFRVVLVVIPAVAVLGFSYAELQVFRYVGAHPGQWLSSYTIVATGLVFAIMFVILGSYGYRFFGRPPESLRVGPSGLEFRFAGKLNTIVGWDDRFLELQMLDRSTDTKVPLEARYRLWVRGGTADRWMPWRRVSPLVYVDEKTFGAVLRSASGAGLSVETIHGFVPISWSSMGPCVAYEIGGRSPPIGFPS